MMLFFFFFFLKVMAKILSLSNLKLSLFSEISRFTIIYTTCMIVCIFFISTYQEGKLFK